MSDHLNCSRRKTAGRWAGARTLALVFAALSLLVARSEAQTTNVITSASPDVINQALQNGGVISLQFNADVVLDTTFFVAVPGTVIDATGFTVTFDGGGVMPILVVPAGLDCVVKNVGFINGRNLGPNGLAGAQGGTLSNGNGQTGGPGGNGADADGGAILNQGTLSLLNCLIGTNSAIGGDGGAGGGGGNGNFVAGAGGNGGNGGNGLGGGVFNDTTGTLVLSNCTIIGNSAFGASGGVGGTNGTGGFSASPGNGGLGGSGSGAGIYSLGALTIWNSTIASNSAASGISQAIGVFQNGTGTPGLPGPSGGGAGVFNHGTAAIINCTFSTNTAFGGDGGNGGPAGFTGGTGGAGGNAFGGAIYNAGGVMGVTNCTISGSVAVGGTNGAAGSGSPTGLPGAMGQGAGNDIANAAGATFLLKNTLITNNPIVVTGAVANGTIQDRGNNLSSDSTPAFSATNSHNHKNPKLGPLANNGGPTRTMALIFDTNSPAIGKADPAAAPPFDQRGFPRGAEPDIGAFQFGASSNNNFSISGRVTTDGVTPLGNVAVSGSSLISTMTDTNGRYTFAGLGAGTYNLNVQPSGFFTPPTLAVAVASADVTNANFVASPLGQTNINGFSTATISSNSTPTNRIFELSFNVLTNSISANRAYYLLASSNLGNPTNWQIIATNVPAGTNLFTLTVTNRYTNYFFSIPLTNAFSNSPMLFFRTVTP